MPLPHASPRARWSWLFDQPYLLLSLTSLFWAGNAIVGRAAAGQIPPVTLSFVRWLGAFLIVLPFAWRHLAKDWPAIRRHLGLMVGLSLSGIAIFNTLQYTALEHTTALNILLFQSAGPLFVAIWSLILLGIRLTLAQALGILVSMIGVLVILLHGDLTALAGIDLNPGDLLFIAAMAIFGFYSALSQKRPAIHGLSFLAFTFGCGALCLVPAFLWELSARPVAQINAANLGSLAYVAVFPSVLAYLCFNRGVQLIGANRAAPFFHLIPVFGSAMAIAFLGERPQLYHAFGYALVLAGVIVAARKPKTRLAE
ncbi:MAG: DMT family transporter [Rhodopseudomonas sp.]|uniref:DMT family transporter n=1 Tax=Rhodopseudomonas sp. TaxID=1078 RepID=UPI0018362960|nr:DMT family transporter [Rhodopseudomonas sp.]NVN87950.1 DMT family transporter [Rhodopseudomonas sp.]